MSKINIKNIIQNIDLEKIEKEKKNGKSLEDILNEIDLRPIIREEMVKDNPNVEEKDIDSVVQEIDLVKIYGSILKKVNSSEAITGKAFEDLSVDEMMLLQGAGDVEADTTPTVTLSSLPCIGATAAVTGAIFSAATC